MNQCEAITQILNERFGFVGLKVTNEMPSNLSQSARQKGGIFIEELLHVVFTKISMSQLIELTHALN